MDFADPISPSCLIIDDEVVVAMDLEERIAEAGFNTHWVNSVQNAAAVLETLTPDIVILDVVVRTRTSIPLAQVLKARGIPFVVHSGYPLSTGLGDFDDAPWVRKLVEISTMIKTMRRLLQRTLTATEHHHAISLQPTTVLSAARE